MKRREFLTNSAIFGTMAVFPFSFPNNVGTREKCPTSTCQK
jgi:hypothetical protein